MCAYFTSSSKYDLNGLLVAQQHPPSFHRSSALSCRIGKLPALAGLKNLGLEKSKSPFRKKYALLVKKIILLTLFNKTFPF